MKIGILLLVLLVSCLPLSAPCSGAEMPNFSTDEEWVSYTRERLNALVPEESEKWAELEIRILPRDSLCASISPDLTRLSVCEGLLRSLSRLEYDLVLTHEAGHVALAHRSATWLAPASSPGDTMSVLGSEKVTMVDYDLLKKQEMEADEFMVDRNSENFSACVGASVILRCATDTMMRSGVSSGGFEVLLSRIEALIARCSKDNI